MKGLLAAAAVATITLGAPPANAQHPHECAVWRHGDCVRWMGRNDRWHVGHQFGPDYAYTDYGALPHVYVVRYHLTPRYRYVYSGGAIYVVDPTTFAVIRILNALGQ